LRRDEMAQMLVNAFSGDDPDRYANPDGTDFFSDDDGNRFEEAINRLMAADVTRGCNPPANDQYCPDRPLNRAEMASFFLRALRNWAPFRWPSLFLHCLAMVSPLDPGCRG